MRHLYSCAYHVLHTCHLPIHDHSADACLVPPAPDHSREVCTFADGEGGRRFRRVVRYIRDVKPGERVERKTHAGAAEAPKDVAGVDSHEGGQNGRNGLSNNILGAASCSGRKVIHIVCVEFVYRGPQLLTVTQLRAHVLVASKQQATVTAIVVDVFQPGGGHPGPFRLLLWQRLAMR